MRSQGSQRSQDSNSPSIAERTRRTPPVQSTNRSPCTSEAAAGRARRRRGRMVVIGGGHRMMGETHPMLMEGGGAERPAIFAIGMDIGWPVVRPPLEQRAEAEGAGGTDDRIGLGEADIAVE